MQLGKDAFGELATDSGNACQVVDAGGLHAPESSEVLEQVKTRTRAGVIRSMRSPEGLAATLAANQALEGDWRQLFKDIDEISKVTADDIQRVANTYFQKKNRTVGMIVPPSSKPKS